jgi:hypothetical protein
MDARGGCAAFGVAGIENGKAFDRPKAEANRRRHNHSPDGSEGEWEMKELRRFSARAWTPADEDRLRELAIAGTSSRAIGMQMNRTVAAVRTRAAQLKITLIKS